MSNYYESGQHTDTDSDVTWTMQEVNADSVNHSKKSRDPVGYRYITQRNDNIQIKLKKKKKKKYREFREDTEETVYRRPKSEEVKRSKNKDLGYGLGLSRGFCLWRTLRDMRHCITKVSDPLTKAQRRSLRRKLSYYVDDLERIVVGVNPRAPVTEADESLSGDEEMREEVNALIEDALDEAALQGKIVQLDYFETRMSSLQQQCSSLKKQLEEVADKKSTQQEAVGKMLPEETKEKRKIVGPRKRNDDGEEEDDELQGREQSKQAETPKASSSLHMSLCSLQAAVMHKISNDVPEEEKPHEQDKERSSDRQVHSTVANSKQRTHSWTGNILAQVLGHEEETPKEGDDLARKNQMDMSRKPVYIAKRGRRGCSTITRVSPQKYVPKILKRISLQY